MPDRSEAIIWDLDWRPPCDAFAPLGGLAHAHLLHSCDAAEDGDWSIIVAHPVDVLSTADARVAAEPFAEWRRRVAAKSAWAPRAPVAFPFISGFVGFVGYETARHIEPSLRLPASPVALPDMAFGYYEAAALFSRKQRRAYIVGRETKACARLRDALGGEGVAVEAPPLFGAVSSNFSAGAYRAAVAEAVENILDGEYYQANLSHRLHVAAVRAFSGYSLFRAMARGSDAGLAALLQYEQGDILSNSPERFFRIDSAAAGARRVTTEPIKGTRPRGRTPAEDAALADALVHDKKDRAENVMIADLMRNDLSRICEDRSIREDAICELRSYANVHHLVSRISGVLRRDVSVIDVFEALFPCGSITGAPKLAAMEAIARIEGVGRGPYCGAIGYMDDRGGADFSVAIRTMTTSPDRTKVVAPVGGGITLQSDPYKEYQETIDKSKDNLSAFGVAPLAAGEAGA